MPTKRPSFLKRQKEQKRAARAIQKREARRERGLAKSAGTPISDEPELNDSDEREMPLEENGLNTD